MPAAIEDSKESMVIIITNGVKRADIGKVVGQQEAHAGAAVQVGNRLGHGLQIGNRFNKVAVLRVPLHAAESAVDIVGQYGHVPVDVGQGVSAVLIPG